MHHYCAFVAGYVEGVCWVLTRALPRLLTHAGYVGETGSLAAVTPGAVRERLNRRACEFEVEWRAEKHPRAADAYFVLLDSIRSDESRSLALMIRQVAELAFKELLRVEPTEKLHLAAMLSAIRQKRIFLDGDVDFNELRRMNAICNKAVHGQDVVLTGEEVHDFVLLLDDSLWTLERFPGFEELRLEEIRMDALDRERKEGGLSIVSTGDRSAVVVDSDHVRVDTGDKTVSERDLKVEIDRQLARLDRIHPRE